MLRTFTLKNGIKVATYTIPQMKSIFLSESVKAGSIFDNSQTSGTAHFMEHILVEGTPSFSNVEALSDFVESIAAGFNAQTSDQTVKFYINFPATQLDSILKLASEVFFEPLFLEESIEKERGAILEEIRQRNDADWYKKRLFFCQTRFRKEHPLLLDSGGLEEVVRTLQKKDLMDYWSRFFYPKNTYLILVGGFDYTQARKLIAKHFGKYQSTKGFPGFPNLTNADMSGWTVAIREDNDLRTCYIDLTFPSVSDGYSLKDIIPQGVVRLILGGLRKSRLYRLLRQRMGLVYSVGVSSSYYQHFGYVGIYTQVAVDKLEEVVNIIFKELKQFVTYGPSEEEISFAKNWLINWSLMRFDHPANIAGWIEGDLLWEERVYTPEEYAKIINRVDKKAVMSFIKKYWELDKLNLTIQGPIENSQANIKKFEKIAEILS